MTDSSTPHVPERRWGFLEPQPDGSVLFVSVPKAPLQLGGLVPPVTCHLYLGERLIVEEPVSATQTGAEGT